jgi:hypothetical protein
MQKRLLSLRTWSNVLDLTSIASDWYLGLATLVLATFVVPSAFSVGVIVAVVVSLQVIGMTLTAHISKNLDSFSRHGTGFLVAIVLTTETNQLLLRISERGFPWWLLVVVAMTLKLLNKTDVQGPRISPVESFDYSLIMSFVVIGLASFTYFWFAPLSLIVAVLAWLRAICMPKKTVWLGFALFAVSLIAVAWRMRPKYWLLIQEEQIFYATLSSSLSHQPSNESIFGVTSGFNYHWLQYGLAGWISRESLVDEIPIMSVVLPLLFAFLAIGLTLSFLGVRTLSLKRQFLIAALLTLFIFRTGLGSGVKILNIFIAPAVSASLAYCASLIGLISQSGRTKPANLCLIFLLAYGAVGSYTTTAIAPIFGTTVALCLSTLFRHLYYDTRRNLLTAAAIVAGSSFALVRFIGFPFTETYDGARIGLFPFLGFVEAQSKEIFALFGSHRVAAKIGYFSGLCAPLLLAVLTQFRRRPSLLTLDLTATITLGAILLPLTQTDSFANQLPILTGTYLFALPLVIKYYVANFRTGLASYYAPVLAIVAWFVWYGLHLATRDLGDISSIRFRYTALALPAVLALLVASTTFLFRAPQPRGSRDSPLSGRNSTKILLHAIGALVVFAVLQGGYALIEGYAYYNHRYETRGKTLEASSETIDAAIWMRANSSRADLYAVDQANSDLELQNLLRISGRRILAIGPTLWAKDFRLDPSGPRLMQLQRNLSVPSAGTLRALMKEGVTGIVLRREVSRVRFREAFGPPVFQNSKWMFYKLSDLISD